MRIFRVFWAGSMLVMACDGSSRSGSPSPSGQSTGQAMSALAPAVSMAAAPLTGAASSVLAPGAGPGTSGSAAAEPPAGPAWAAGFARGATLQGTDMKVRLGETNDTRMFGVSGLVVISPAGFRKGETLSFDILYRDEDARSKTQVGFTSERPGSRTKRSMDKQADRDATVFAFNIKGVQWAAPVTIPLGQPPSPMAVHRGSGKHLDGKTPREVVLVAGAISGIDALGVGAWNTASASAEADVLAILGSLRKAGE
jgi:hypothetical protein